MTPTRSETPRYEPLGPPRYRGRKFLLGCLVAFLAMVLIVVVAAIAFSVWLRTPSPPLQAHHLADDGTVFFAELTLRAEDPGVRDLLRSSLRGQWDEGWRQVPGPLQFIFGVAERQEPQDREIDRVLPLELVWTRQADGEGRAGPFLLAISLPRAGHTMQLMDRIGGFVLGLRGSTTRQGRHRGEEIYRLSEESGAIWTSIVGADILVAREKEALTSGIDRLARYRDPKAGPPSPPLMAARPAGAAFFLAAAEGHGDAAAEILEATMPAFGTAVRPLMKDAGQVSLWGKFSGADALEGEFRIAEGRRGAPPETSEYAGTVTVPLEEGDVVFTLTPAAKAAGERHAFRIEISGVEAAARHGLAALERPGRHRRLEISIPSPEPPEPPGAPQPPQPGRSREPARP